MTHGGTQRAQYCVIIPARQGSAPFYVGAVPGRLARFQTAAELPSGVRLRYGWTMVGTWKEDYYGAGARARTAIDECKMSNRYSFARQADSYGG